MLLPEFVHQPGVYPMFEAMHLGDHGAGTYEYSATSRAERILAPGVSAVAALIDIHVNRETSDAVWIEGVAGGGDVLPIPYSLTLRYNDRARLLEGLRDNSKVAGPSAAAWAAGAIDPDAFQGGDFLHDLEPPIPR